LVHILVGEQRHWFGTDPSGCSLDSRICALMQCPADSDIPETISVKPLSIPIFIS
jgi:hypothetical protein